jgi:hypothetical protein
MFYRFENISSLMFQLASVIAAGKKDEFQAEIDAGCAQLVPTFTSLFDQLDVSHQLRTAIPGLIQQVNSTLPNYMLTGDAIFGESGISMWICFGLH